MKLSDKTYDFIKNVVLPALTGLATFLITFGELWHLPADTMKAVAGTLTALATFISFMLSSASKVYFKDKEIIETDINNKDVTLNG